MNPQSENSVTNGAAAHVAGPEVEATLRLIAALPAPAGLEDRIHAALGSALDSAAAQKRKPGRMLAWRSTLGTGGVLRSGPGSAPTGAWMRSAAAAAIVFVVAGGAWGVYSRVQPRQPGRVISVPTQVEAHGSFAGAGAIRTPQTLNGPVITHPVKAHAAPQKSAKKTAVKNAAMRKLPAQAAAPDAH
jgi:hypothetical protein